MFDTYQYLEHIAIIFYLSKIPILTILREDCNIKDIVNIIKMWEQIYPQDAI